jgi:diguanylate cyclase (GGDEF)-like protein
MFENKIQWFGSIPKWIWLVILISYAIPLSIEMDTSEDLITETQVSIAWFICLIPTLIFSYYNGFIGGITSTFFSTVLHVLTELIDDTESKFLQFEWYLLGEVTIVNIIISAPVSFLVNKLRLEKNRLEVTNEELKKTKEEINKMAYYDPLTQLPNRRFFEENFIQSLNEATEDNGELTILFIDLDGFKKVNDTFGHNAGDFLLKEVASRLTSCIHDNDTVSRLAGDEFVIILPQSLKERTIRIAERILDELQTPVTINNQRVIVTPSIGIAIYPEHGQDPDTLINHADKAMYQAKKQGKNNYQIYQSVLEELKS